jgi:hypothetical protein
MCAAWLPHDLNPPGLPLSRIGRAISFEILPRGGARIPLTGVPSQAHRGQLRAVVPDGVRGRAPTATHDPTLSESSTSRSPIQSCCNAMTFHVATKRVEVFRNSAGTLAIRTSTSNGSIGSARAPSPRAQSRSQDSRPCLAFGLSLIPSACVLRPSPSCQTCAADCIPKSPRRASGRSWVMWAVAAAANCVPSQGFGTQPAPRERT